MPVAVIGQPGSWSTDCLAAALGRAGADVLVVDLGACSLRLPDTRLFHRGRPLPALDGAVVKKIGDTATGTVVAQRLNLLHHLHGSGVPVLSPPSRLEVAVNRYRMTVELVRSGVPVPETLVTEDPAEAEAAVERFGAAVVKPLYTSKGRGMQRVDPSLDLRAFFTRWRHESDGPIYLQRFVKHPGRDLGVAVLEGACLGAYWRVARDDQWMTTILSGGRYEPAEPPPTAVDIALRAAEHFGLLFTGVDLMETSEGGWAVLEVSAFGGFRGLLEARGVDAAPALAAAALAQFRRHRSAA
jgi:ribosomal protein S6--L-glutamate ligase